MALILEITYKRCTHTQVILLALRFHQTIKADCDPEV